MNMCHCLIEEGCDINDWSLVRSTFDLSWSFSTKQLKENMKILDMQVFETQKREGWVQTLVEPGKYVTTTNQVSADLLQLVKILPWRVHIHHHIFSKHSAQLSSAQDSQSVSNLFRVCEMHDLFTGLLLVNISDIVLNKVF